MMDSMTEKDGAQTWFLPVGGEVDEKVVARDGPRLLIPGVSPFVRLVNFAICGEIPSTATSS